MRSWQTSTWKDRKECVSRRERISDIKFSSSLLSPFPLPLPPSNTTTSRTNPPPFIPPPFSSSLIHRPRNSGEKGKPRNNNFPRFRRKERIVVGDESDEFLSSFLLDVLYSSEKAEKRDIAVDGVVGRNSGESSSRIGRRKGRGRKGPLSWPKQALIYTAGRASVGRSGNALPGSEPMGAYVTCRWLDSPPSSPPLVNCGGFEYFARTSTLSLHVPRLTPISYARSISSCVAFYTHSIRKPFFAPVPLHLHVHSRIFARIGSIVSDRSRTCNGSRFGAARFEIFLVYRLDEERERGRERGQ